MNFNTPSFFAKLFNKGKDKLHKTQGYKTWRYNLYNNKALVKFNQFFDFFIKIRLQ